MYTVTPSAGLYIQVLDRNPLPDGSELLHINELPPPYESVVNEERNSDDDWKALTIEIQPLYDQPGKYGFAISGGIDTIDGPGIVVSHIDSPSKSRFDHNGRTNLALFDRICSINGIDLTDVTHDEAAHAFALQHGRAITLQIRRLDPRYIEQVDIQIPSSNDALGLTLRGGAGNDNIDPGLFISKIDSNSLLAPFAKSKQLRIDDRLLQIKTNRISVDLRWITRSKAGEFIRRVCEDHTRITLVVAHRFP